MSRYLGGEPHEIIGDLRTQMGISQKELSELIGVAPSQVSRIEKGQTLNISSDILISLAEVFDVSADYILGLSTVRARRNYEVSKLGLSEKTVKTLMAEKFNMQIFNSIVEHRLFSYLIQLITNYMNDSDVEGFMARNEIIDMATSTIADYAKSNSDNAKEIKNDILSLKSHKMTAHEADRVKIENTFWQIIQEIKKNAENKELPSETATAEFMKGIQEQLKDTPKENVSAEHVADIVTNMVEQQLQMDEKNSELFKQLAINLFENFGKEKNNDGE